MVILGCRWACFPAFRGNCPSGIQDSANLREVSSRADFLNTPRICRDGCRVLPRGGCVYTVSTAIYTVYTARYGYVQLCTLYLQVHTLHIRLYTLHTRLHTQYIQLDTAMCHSTGSREFTPATARDPGDLHRRAPHRGGHGIHEIPKMALRFQARFPDLCVNENIYSAWIPSAVGETVNSGILPGVGGNFVTCTVLRLQNFLTQHGSWLEKMMHPGSFPLER